ncbi:hypothetical protein [Xanthobacter sp. ZOL 2024]
MNHNPTPTPTTLWVWTLVEQLVEACSNADQTTAKNAQRFIVGLSYLRRDDLTSHIRNRLVKAKAENSDYRSVIMRAASANAAILDGYDAPSQMRIRSLLEAAVDETKASVAVTQLSHPVYLLGSMLETLGEAKVLAEFADIAHKIVDKYSYTGSLVKRLAGAPELKKPWLTKMKKEAGSSTFDTANRFAANIPDIDELLGELIKSKDAFEIVVAVCGAADTGAFTSKDLRSGRFLAAPKLREMALTFVKKSATTAGKIVKEAGVAKDLKGFLETYLDDEK